MEKLFKVFGGYTDIFFCSQCECLCIRCEDCGNTSCNGEECDKCDEKFKAFEKINEDFYKECLKFREKYK